MEQVEAEPSDARTPWSTGSLWARIRGLATVALIFVAVFALHRYIGHRLFVRPELPMPWRALGEAVMVALYLSLPLGFVTSRLRPSRATQAVQWIAFLWMGAFGIFVPLAATLHGLFALLGAMAPAAMDALPIAAPALESALLAGIGLGALAFGFVTARTLAKVERVTHPFPKLGVGLEGIRLVQLTDVHVGQTLDGAYFGRLVDKVNALAPDIVVITGDLVEGTVSSIRGELAALSKLRAPLGVFFVTGNHEYYHGAPAWEAEVARHGVQVLSNRHVVVERGGARLVIAGVTDYDAGHFFPEQRSNPAAALEGAPADVPRVLLAHQPRSAFAASGLGVDLQLSGHTHGGQIFPWTLLVRLQQPAVTGFKKVGDVRVYTSRGTAYWGPPVRLGPSPEITEHRFVRG